jgi:hypothetical protein
MADIKISELLPASTPLDGTETLPIVQNGNTVRASTQDVAGLFSLGYTAENVVNKSTDSSFAGASDLNYPSQLAVKTYVDNTLGNAGWGLSGNSGTTSVNFIGTTDNQNLNLKVNNNTALTLDAATGYVDVKSKLRVNVSNTVYAQLDADSNKGRLLLYNSSATSQVSLNCNNLTASRILQLPNASGTLVATVNGTAPDPSGNVTINAGWGLTGNSGTTAGTNFIGTTDGQDLVFKVNNNEVARLDTYNTLNVNGFLTCKSDTSAEVYATNNNFTQYASISWLNVTTAKPTLELKNGTYAACLTLVPTLTANRILQLPDKDGILATEDYKVYAAIVQYSSNVLTLVNVLKNTLNATISFSNFSTGIDVLTASSSVFTNNKSIGISASYNSGTSLYNIILNNTSTTIFNLQSLRTSTGANQVSNNIPFFIEIRVYL